MTHPLRTLASNLMDMGQFNPNWSQVCGQFAHLSDYCQLIAGISEAHEREAQLRAEVVRLSAELVEIHAKWIVAEQGYAIERAKNERLKAQNTYLFRMIMDDALLVERYNAMKAGRPPTPIYGYSDAQVLDVLEQLSMNTSDELQSRIQEVFMWLRKKI